MQPVDLCRHKYACFRQKTHRLPLHLNKYTFIAVMLATVFAVGVGGIEDEGLVCRLVKFLLPVL